MKKIGSFFRSKKNGGIESWAVFLIIIFFICYSLSQITSTPFAVMATKYKLMDINRGAAFRVESDGGLTVETTQLIKDFAQEKGLDPSLLTISCNQVITPGIQHFTTFGTKLTLTLSYEYRYTEKELKKGLVVEESSIKTKIITDSISTTAKN